MAEKKTSWWVSASHYEDYMKSLVESLENVPDTAEKAQLARELEARYRALLKGNIAAVDLANQQYELDYVSTFTQRNLQTPPFSRLSALTDWVPSAGLRKRQRKLLADEMADIIEFRQQGRWILARWRVVWVWIHWTRYLLAGPLSAAMRALKKMSAN